MSSEAINSKYRFYSISYAILSLFLVIVIYLTHTNQMVFLKINSLHFILPDFIYKSINYVTDPHHYILLVSLVAITYIWKRKFLVNVVIICLLYLLIFSAIKHLLPEARPFVVFNPMSINLLGYNPMDNAADYHSFPSGHVGNIAIFIFTFNLLFIKNKNVIQLIMLFLIVVTAFTRIVSGMHWPIDVLTSGFIAYLIVWFGLIIKFKK